MENILSAWGKIEKRLKGRYVCLFLDCDGTIAPIADSPDKAEVPGRTKSVLSSLAKAADTSLAVISGRPLSELKSLIGLSGIIYAGNHGLEVEGIGDITPWQSPSDYKNDLGSAKELLVKKFSSTRGILIEDKGSSLCVHYRMANVDEKQFISEILETIESYVSKGKFSILYGKKVVEVRPPGGWNKGDVVRMILERARSDHKDKDTAAVYVGDDVTDEDAFRVLSDGGITVVVGDRPGSLAKYRAGDTAEVYEFLVALLRSREA